MEKIWEQVITFEILLSCLYFVIKCTSVRSVVGGAARVRVQLEWIQGSDPLSANKPLIPLRSENYPQSDLGNIMHRPVQLLVTAQFTV